MSAPSRPLHKKLAALLFGLVSALVLAELGMRTAGWLAYTLSGRGDEAGSADVTILCHGDSNVFGLWESPKESYPGQLEKLLNERSGGKRYKVVNLGVPGMGSRHLLSVIEADIARVQPDLVLVTVGANDSWSWKPESGIDYIEPPFWADFRLAKAWRAYKQRNEKPVSNERNRPEIHDSAELKEETKKLGKVYTFKNREGEELLRYSGETTVHRPSEDVFLPFLKKNLTQIHELVGERLVIIGYGADAKIYASANPILRELVSEREIPYVEPSPLLKELESRTSFGEVFYSDHHPRGLGYEVIARMAYSKLVELGVAEGSVIEDPLENLSAHERYVPPVRLVGSLANGDLAVEVEGEEPGRDFTLVLWDVNRDGKLPPTRPYDKVLKNDPFYRWCIKDKSMRGTFDENGDARISLRSLLEQRVNDDDDMIGTRFRVGYLIHISKTDRRYARWSSGVTVEIE